MSDDLRTRIAAVLYERSVRRAGLDFKWATLTQDVVKQSWLDDADAVIRELGLQYERSEWPFDGKHRFVTEWTESKSHE